MRDRTAQHVSFAIHGRNAVRVDPGSKRAWSTMRRLDQLGYHLVTRSELRARLLELELCRPDEADDVTTRLLEAMGVRP